MITADRVGPKIPSGQLLQLSRLIEARLGIYFPRERWEDLQRRMRGACSELGLPELCRCVDRLLSAPMSREYLDILAGHLTVGESYFFRDAGAFRLLEERVVPEWIRTRGNTNRRLRIWVAGCSTGEEAYSVALLLLRLIPDCTSWNIHISATDINTRALRKAREGTYSRWSFRGTPRRVVEKYFLKEEGERYTILPRLREMVSFSFLNLAEDVFPSLATNSNALDMILCRNVLMYFSAQRAGRILNGFHRCLLEDGWLVLSPVEAPLADGCGFHPLGHNAAGFFRKTGKTWSEPQCQIPEAVHGVGVGREQQGKLRCDRTGREARQDQLYREAVRLYAAGGYGAATEKLSRLLEQQEGRQKDGSFPYGAACALLARSLANKGRLQEALQCSEKAQAADKLHPSHRYLRSAILQELGKRDEAIAALRQALYLDPCFALAHYALGNLLRSRGQREESDRYLRNAFEIAAGLPLEEELPESDGLTAGSLAELIGAIIGGEVRS